MLNKESLDQVSEGNHVSSLEDEITEFASSLPYWGRYLSSRILSGFSITDDDVESAWEYFQEDIGLKEVSSRPEINIFYSKRSNKKYKASLVLTKLHKAEGVNALVENQTLEFCPHITVVYGMNGVGKSSYIRLFKKAFFNRAEEDILPNVHLENGHKVLNAEFCFSSQGGANYSLNYPNDSNRSEFNQFSVFDSKSVHVHLNKKNQFEFRPAGLNFFAELNEAFKQVEERIEIEAGRRGGLKDYASFFDGNSVIKTLLTDLSHKTKIEELNCYLPFTDADVQKRKSLEEDKAKLQLLKKDKEIFDLTEKKKLLHSFRQQLLNNNKYFTQQALEKVNSKIKDCSEKEAIAKRDGINNFDSKKLAGVGSSEWKAFIEAADNFAKVQSDNVYPLEKDICLLCQQPLTTEAQELILCYWKFIQSRVELDAKEANEALNKIKLAFEQLQFDLLPTDSVLTKWLEEQNEKNFNQLNESLLRQKSFASTIIDNIVFKRGFIEQEALIDISSLDLFESILEQKIQALREQDPTLALDKLTSQITLLNHREKLGQHITSILKYIGDLNWVQLVNSARKKINRRKVTDKEKELSKLYFNQAYLDRFNYECSELRANFGIQINHTGSDGTSFRQLQFKGKQPSLILSEGEQKVISLGDFLAEMELSDINRGIIFDDPVTSLDNERKQIIADRLVKVAKNRQVIIFTHDLVFFNCLSNSSKLHLKGIENCFKSHTIDKEGPQSYGRVTLNYTPDNQSQYKSSKKAKEFLIKSKSAPGHEVLGLVRGGYSALRTSYEYLISTVIVGSVVQRFNPQIRVGRLKEMKFDSALIEEVITNHGEISDFIEGHLLAEEVGILPSADMLEDQIQRFDSISTRFEKL